MRADVSAIEVRPRQRSLLVGGMLAVTLAVVTICWVLTGGWLVIPVAVPALCSLGVAVLYALVAQVNIGPEVVTYRDWTGRRKSVARNSIGAPETLRRRIEFQDLNANQRSALVLSAFVWDGRSLRAAWEATAGSVRT